MRENRLRTAGGGPVGRSPSAAAGAAARVRALGRDRAAGGTAPAEPGGPRRVRRVRGRLAGVAGAAARDDQTRLRAGQDQGAGRGQTDREVVHAGRAKEPLRAPERDDVRDDVRDTGDRRDSSPRRASYFFYFAHLFIARFQEADEKLWHDEKVQLQIALMKAFDANNSSSSQNDYADQVLQQV